MQNTVANVSLGSGVLLIVGYLGAMCLGFIPLLGLLNLVLYPLLWVVALVGLVTGGMGLMQAGNFGGEGKVQAIIGMAIPILWGLFQLAMLVLGFGLVFLSVALDSM